MWQAWNDTAAVEDLNNSNSMFKGDLVLSWKQINVTVVKKNPKLFGRSEIVHQKILDNGKNREKLAIMFFELLRRTYSAFVSNVIEFGGA